MEYDNRTYTTMGDSVVLTLSKSVLEQLGVEVGDQIDVAVVDKSAVIRSLKEAQQTQKLDDIVHCLISCRWEVYEQLATGAE